MQSCCVGLKKLQPFGYIPNKKRNMLKDIIYRIIGYPYLIRRIQARSIFRLADSMKDMTILDLGCGDGLFCIEYARRGAKSVVGIDMRETQIKYGREVIKKVGLNNIELFIGNAESIPLASNSFDLVISNCALEHMENDDLVLKEVNRCLKPTGSLILTIPYDKRRKILPIIDIMIKMPRFIKKLFAPEYIHNTHSYQEAIWKLKRERFQEVRNYSLSDISNKLSAAGFELSKYENNVKFFGAMCWDLITGLKMFHLNKGTLLAFPLMYPISLLDEFLPKHSRGEEMALRADVRRV